MPALLSRFNTSRNRSLDHSRPLPTSGPHRYGLRWLRWLGGSPAAICLQVTANWRTNGKTSHRYQITNSPTSRGRYRWMILTSFVAWNPLWYAVTITTIPSSINIFRRWLVSVFTCWILNNSGALAGAPPVKCTATASFSLNRATCWKYLSILWRLTSPRVVNARATAGSPAIWSTSQCWPATGHVVRWSCRKLQPGLASVGLSNKACHGMAGH